MQARQGHPVKISEAASPPTEAATRSERAYWNAATALAREETQVAIATVSATLADAKKIGNDELAWRVAAIGAAAARALGDGERERALRVVAIESRARLRTAWGTPAGRYERRPDLVELCRASELED
jgi:hypothetical protein